MSLLINCPLGDAIAAIPIGACPESIGQIQKVVFQRVFSAAGVKNKLVIASEDPKLLASWTALMAAADGTKAVPSPFIQAPVFEAGAAREFGGGNETLGGVPITIGREPTTFTGMILQTSQDTIKEMKKYQGEEVGVFLIDEYGRLIGLADDNTSATEFFPIPLSSLFVGDKVFGGLEGVDSNVISWRFAPNYSDEIYVVTPTDFNALNLVAP